MKADVNTSTAVIGVLNRYVDAVAKRDVEGVLELMAPDTETIVFGTGQDERRIGQDELKAQLERDFSQSEKIYYEMGWRFVSSSGSVAWVATEGVADIRAHGKKFHLPVRLTAVLEQHGDRWYFVQLHNSLPASGQRKGESFPD